MGKKREPTTGPVAARGTPSTRGQERRLEVIELVRNLLLHRAHSDGELLSVATIKRELEEKSAIKNACTTQELRAAFKSLSDEGLLNIVPQVGTVLRKPSVEEIGELIGLRWALESYAAIRLSQMEDVKDRLGLVEDHQEELKKLAGKANLEGREADRFRQADIEFHREILRQAGRTRGIPTLDSWRRSLAIPLYKRFYTPMHSQAVVKEHQDILDAIKPIAEGSPGEQAEDEQEKRIRNALHIHLSNAIARSWKGTGPRIL
jgi:DNA-binding GntR family transcriptional regulator